MERSWLKRERENAGRLTQEEVADRIGVARTTYAMIEQGNRNPSVDLAIKIAKFYGFDWTIFFDNKLHESCQSKPTSKEVS